MVERIARILCKQADRDPDEVVQREDVVTGTTRLGWEAFISNAIEMLEAMREPTEAMVKAVSYDLRGEWFWQTMIGAALVEGPSAADL